MSLGLMMISRFSVSFYFSSLIDQVESKAANWDREVKRRMNDPCLTVICR